MDPRKIISDEEIERVHANANFGSMSKRDVVNEGVWKAACEWHMGHTMATIIVEHGLAKWRKEVSQPYLTAKGKKYLFAALRNAKISWPTP